MRKHIISLFLFISILLGALSFNFPVYADVSPAYEMTGIFRYVHEGWRSSGVVLPITEAKKYMDNSFLENQTICNDQERLSGYYKEMDTSVLGVLYHGDMEFSDDSFDIEIFFTEPEFKSIFPVGQYGLPTNSKDFSDYPLLISYDVARLEITIQGTTHVLAESFFDATELPNFKTQCNEILDVCNTSFSARKIYSNMRLSDTEYVVTYLPVTVNSTSHSISIPISWFDFADRHDQFSGIDATIRLRFYKEDEIVTEAVPCTFSLQNWYNAGTYFFRGQDPDVCGYVVGTYDVRDIVYVTNKVMEAINGTQEDTTNEVPSDNPPSKGKGGCRG